MRADLPSCFLCVRQENDRHQRRTVSKDDPVAARRQRADTAESFAAFGSMLINPIHRWFAFGLLLVCLQGKAVAAPREITPQQLFAGHSEGNGSLKLLFSKEKHFHVDSHGAMQSDGRFRLDQTIVFEGEPSQDRHWILETTAPGIYAGILSDAPGRVKGKMEGNRLTLCYRIKGPMFMHQTLTLLPDGRTIDNVDKITLLGIPIGRLHETIIRENPIVP